MRVLEATFAALAGLPGDFASWATSLNDATFASIMIMAAIALTFVIARALR